jgi:glycerate kinase
MLPRSMALKVIIIPDKFKGTLRADEAAEAIARGWRKARQADVIELLPMSDGGDGFGAVMRDLLNAKEQRTRAHDAAHRVRTVKWWWEGRTKLSVIESAEAIGLAMLPRGKFHPFALDTFGLGELIQTAAARGAQRCIMGIGGSATNDGGFGMARALGWRFMDGAGEIIEKWTELQRLEHILAPRRRKLFAELIVAVDVQNPLLGKVGATRVYGPQKGLRPGDFERAEKCLGRLARVVRQQFGSDLARVAGTGAAGGLGFGLAAFLGARLEPGFELFARTARLKGRLRSADVVITGEGAIDESTLMGKGVGEIANLCRRLGIPCIGLAGKLGARKELGKVFPTVWGMTQLTTERRAQARPKFWLERLAEEAGKQWRNRAA